MQVKDVPEPAFSLHGKFYDQVVDRLKITGDQLLAIDCTLPLGLLKPASEYTPQEEEVFQPLTQTLKEEIETIKKGKKTFER